MGEEPAGRLSLNLLLQRLDFIQEYWYDVGETLNVSDRILHELQSSPQANASPEKNLMAVIIEWIEANQSQIILPSIVEALRDAPFMQQNSRLLEKLNNLQVPNRRDVRRTHTNAGRQFSREEENESSSEDDNMIEEQHTSRCCSSRGCSSCCRALGNCLFSRKTLGLILNCLVVVVAVILVGNVGENHETKDALDRIMLEDQEYADKLLKISAREIRILVTGKTGTGKSALINGLIGDNVTIEGESLDPETTEVGKFSRTVQGVPMLVFDSPGLQDGTENEKEYLLDMETKCKKVDLVMYTLKMSDERLHTDDVEAMKKLTNAFGAKFWESAMFVLTFANKVQNPEKPEDDDENRMYFERRLGKWKEKLPRTVVKELNVPEKVAQRIPVIPAGYYKRAHLPGRRYWFSQFWKVALDRMKDCSHEGYSFMLRFNKDRFRRAYEVTEEDLQKKLDQQPIVVTNTTSLAPSVMHSAPFLLVITCTCSYISLV